MPRKSKLTKREGARKVIAGLATHFPAGRAIVLERKRYTRAQLTGLFQAHIDALDEIDAAHATFAAAVRRERAVARATHRLTMILQRFVGAAFGTNAAVLGDFGWEVPKKPGPKTTGAKLAGVTAGRATRKARKPTAETG
jgi:hypothetical protein